jgi:predicted  nucleic acid-binding Zn ribbon protein
MHLNEVVMFLVQIAFGTDANDRSRRAELSDAAETYLAAVFRNGQIYGNYDFAWEKHRLTAYTHVLEPNALAKKHHSAWGRDTLRAVVKAFGQPPDLRVIDDSIPNKSRTWKQSSFLFLFTHAFDESSPVVCGDSGVRLPVYQFPLEDQTRDELYSWAGQYRDLDRVWLSSGALEIPAYKQLAEPDSELSNYGRELGREIERATARPAYYYLRRYWGRSAGEESRLCPGCGGRWRVSGTTFAKKPFHQFALRCQRCRLVSHVADTCDDERHARIGEFKQAKRRRAK